MSKQKVPLAETATTKLKKLRDASNSKILNADELASIKGTYPEDDVIKDLLSHISGIEANLTNLRSETFWDESVAEWEQAKAERDAALKEVETLKANIVLMAEERHALANRLGVERDAALTRVRELEKFPGHNPECFQSNLAEPSVLICTYSCLHAKHNKAMQQRDAALTRVSELERR